MKSKEAESNNQVFWDEIAPVHEKSYDMDRLKSRVSQIDAIQKLEFYPVKDKKLLHLQCHIGTDSISLGLDGADVTAIDFSGKSIEIARKLNEEVGTKVNFIVSDVFHLKGRLDRKFDMVYTSKGVITWISDIQAWAETISYYLKSGGIFYMMEIHPLKMVFDEAANHDLRVKYSYFHQDEPAAVEDCPDYSNQSYVPENKTYEWSWSVSDIVNALISHGMQIELLNEYDKLFYKGFPGMVRDDEGWWHLEESMKKLPLTLTIRARKL